MIKKIILNFLKKIFAEKKDSEQLTIFNFYFSKNKNLKIKK